MPKAKALFSEIADVHVMPGREIANKYLMHADALLCRSITQVNAQLLANTNVRFVGSATIGIDHLDTDWLDRANIRWVNSPGCNAAAVAQYVLSAMAYWAEKRDKSLIDLTVGIVGAGNVGTELSRCLSTLSIKHQLCDPPLQEAGDSREFVKLASILECDVISLHVPLTHSGNHSTYHLIDHAVLNHFSSEQLLINASRGAVVDNNALLSYLEAQNIANCVLDVYENEPAVNYDLVQACLLATPHIAGHSLEGKVRGSYSVYSKFCEHFDITVRVNESQLYPKKNKANIDGATLERALLSLYDIKFNSNLLKASDEMILVKSFDLLRKNATKLESGLYRRDYSGWSVHDERLPASLFSL